MSSLLVRYTPDGYTTPEYGWVIWDTVLREWCIDNTPVFIGLKLHQIVDLVPCADELSLGRHVCLRAQVKSILDHDVAQDVRTVLKGDNSEATYLFGDAPRGHVTFNKFDVHTSVGTFEVRVRLKEEQ